jgi:hypothetical protein
MDTHPLRPPATWVTPSDLEPWEDPETGSNYSSTSLIQAIFGIEADYPPDTDEYWRLGYYHPVQITQWALASAPGHPIFDRFMDNLLQSLHEVASHNGGDLKTISAVNEVQNMDPISLTGPASLTVSAQSWLEEKAGLRWNALTAMYDGGRSKVVDNVMILPITGFRYSYTSGFPPFCFEMFTSEEFE